MSDNGNRLIDALKARMQPPPSVVLAVPGVFSAEAVLNALSGKLSEAENTLAEAKVEHRKAALDEQKNVPGAAARKSAAVAALKEAQSRLDDLLAAQVAADLEKRENALRERHAKEEAEDAKALRAGEEYAAALAKWIELAPEIGKAWAKIVDAERGLINRLQASSPRLRKVHDVIYNVEPLALLEIARTAPLKSGNMSTPNLPYGMSAQDGACTARPFSAYAADIKIVLEREVAAASAARAKARK